MSSDGDGFIFWYRVGSILYSLREGGIERESGGCCVLFESLHCFSRSVLIALGP
jgi:hypothetical protein